MIKVFFRTDVVEASHVIDADKAELSYAFGYSEEPILRLFKHNEVVAEFNSGVWIYWYKEENENG